LFTRKPYAIKAKKYSPQLSEEPSKVAKKKGTIAGAVALIIGTSIGSGILALPKKASPAVLLSKSFSYFDSMVL
jgi:tyrosine-specific transport protein